MDRRSFLWESGGGLGGIALAALLGESGLLAAGDGKIKPAGPYHLAEDYHQQYLEKRQGGARRFGF